VTWPTLTVPTVYHVGTLNPVDKGKTGHPHSLEGHGLSVSPCPAAWERIAQLGGSPWWQLDRPEGRFLDALRLSDRQRAQITDWAVEHGYVRRRKVWYAVVFDDELDDELWLASTTRRDALCDAVDRQGGDYRQGGDCSLSVLRDAVRPGEQLHSLEPLDRLLGFRPDGDCFDYCLVAYVERCLPELDGIWWEERYGYLSAPRAVILPGKLDRWSSRRLTSTGRVRLEPVGEDAFA
jgi:hypothetical protein